MNELSLDAISLMAEIVVLEVCILEHFLNKRASFIHFVAEAPREHLA